MGRNGGNWSLHLLNQLHHTHRWLDTIYCIYSSAETQCLNSNKLVNWQLGNKMLNRWECGCNIIDIDTKSTNSVSRADLHIDSMCARAGLFGNSISMHALRFSTSSHYSIEFECHQAAQPATRRVEWSTVLVGWLRVRNPFVVSSSWMIYLITGALHEC